MKPEFVNTERFADTGDAPQTTVKRSYRLLFGYKVQRSTMLIGLMFVLGAGWVFWESRASGPKTAVAASVADDPTITMNLDQMQMEAAIGQVRETRKQQLLAPILKGEERRRIHLLAPSRDPFALVTEQEKPKTDASLDHQPIVTEPVVEEPPPSVDGLELRSVLVGAVPTAIINGYLIQEGQVISGWTVAKITPAKVVLQWRNHQHVLTMP